MMVRRPSRRHVTLAGIVSAATLVLASLGMLANGIVALNEKVGASGALTDSLFANDTTLFARVERIERRLGMKKRGGQVPARPEQVGLVRKLFRLLF